MSITSILQNSVSGLNASQVALRNTSNNISNVNNLDYARRSVSFQSRVLGGVEVSDVSRIANDFLTREALLSTSSLGAASATLRLHDRLQSVFGNPNSEGALPGLLNRLFSDIAELQVEPASAVRRATAVNSMQLLFDEFGSLTDSIQKIRLGADQELASRISEINDLIKNIHELNIEVVSSAARGTDVNALIDQRQKSLTALAKYMDTRITPQLNGSVYVASTDGTFLVNANMTELHYDNAGAATADTIFSRITLHSIDLASGVVSPTGLPLEPHIISGELRGLLDMRDVTLPKFGQEIGELASKLADQLNRVHNENAAMPAPNQLIGRNTGLLGVDAHNFSGVVNFSITDPAGLTVTSVRADFTTGQYSVNGGPGVAFAGGSINDIVAGINTGLGAGGMLSFSNGVMRFSAANPANGAAMLQDPTAPSVRAGRGFSHFFGMNDLVSADAPSHYETGLTGADAHGFTAGQTVRMKVLSPSGQVAIDYTLTIAGATIDDIINQLNNPVTGMGAVTTFSLDANGKLAQTPAPGYQGYKLFVIDDQTSRGAAGTPLSKLFGLAPGARDDQASGMQVKPGVVSNLASMALGKLNITPPGGVAIGYSDGRGALQLHALEEALASFAQAGHLSGAKLTLADYAGQFLGNTARLAAQADQVKQDREGINEEIKLQIGQVSGVNLDEEMSNLVVYQNSYNAAARMIKAAQEMLATLLAVI